MKKLLILALFLCLASVASAVTVPPWWMIEQSFEVGSGSANKMLVDAPCYVLATGSDNPNGISDFSQCSNEVYDTHSAYSAGVFTAPFNGIFWGTLECNVASNTANSWFSITAATSSGYTIVADFKVAASGGPDAIGLALPWSAYLAKGEQFLVGTYNDTGSRNRNMRYSLIGVRTK